MHKNEKTIQDILNDSFWPTSLETNQSYFRTHDDCDGDLSKGISVVISIDGDAHIWSNNGAFSSCRYRIPISGGGRSPRVRNALLILAMAIKLDNEEDPIDVGRNEAPHQT